MVLSIESGAGQPRIRQQELLLPTPRRVELFQLEGALPDLALISSKGLTTCILIVVGAMLQGLSVSLQ